MRIALVSAAVPWPENQTTGVYNTIQARELTALGHPTELFIPALGGPKWVERLIPQFRHHNSRPDRYEFDGVVCHGVKRTLPPPYKLRSLFEREPAVAARLYQVAYAEALARQIARFRPDFILGHAGILLGAMLPRLSAVAGVPFGVIEHDPVELRPETPLGRHYIRTVGRAKVIFNVGFKWVKYMREVMGLKQVRLASNGAVFATQQQLATPRPEKWRGRRLLLNVATLNLRRKAQPELLAAYAELVKNGIAKDTLLLFVGEPPADLLHLVDELGLSQCVEFLPKMSPQEVQQYMVWADLFVMPSWAESFGLVYVEAMAAQTPPIMTTDSGVAALIDPKEHGWIVPPRDHGALVSAMTEALTSADLPAMGRAGRKLVEEKFTWRRNAETIIAGIRGEPPTPDPVVPEHWLKIG